MADSKRDILLHIAATAEFAELKALNTELKESINTVARLRMALKGDVGGTGLRGVAAGAVEAGKATRRLKEEVLSANASLTEQADKIRATGKLVKTHTTKKVTPDGTRTFGSEVYDMGGGIGKEIKTRGKLISSIKDTDAARRREGEELKKQKALGKQWAAEIDAGATGRVRQLNLERRERLDQERLGAQMAIDAEKKIAQARKGSENMALLQANEERKMALERKKADAAGDERQKKLEAQRNLGAHFGENRQLELERRERLDQIKLGQQMAADTEKRIARQAKLNNMERTFRTEASRKGAVVTPAQIYNQKTGATENVLQLTNKLTGAQFQLNQATGKVTGGFRDLSAAQEKSGDSFGKILGKVAVWSVATGAIFGSLRAIKGAITEYAAIEKGTIAISRVTENFGQGMKGIGSGAKELTNDILDLSVSYGQNTAEAMNAAVIYGRLGMSQKEVADAMKYTMVTANISGYGMEESAKGIASMVQQFKLGAKDIPLLVDKLALVDRLSSATMGDLMEAGSRAAGVWHNAGGSVEEFLAVIGVVAQKTGRTGAEISNAFKTMVTRLGTAETQKKIFELSGISIRDEKGNIKDPLSILRELKKTTAGQATGIASEIEGETAGARQINYLINALEGLPEIEKQIAEQAKSSGSALQQNQMYLEGMASKADQLAAAWDRFTYALMNGSAASSMKWWLDRFREMLSLGKEGQKGPSGGKNATEAKYNGYTPTLNPITPSFWNDVIEEEQHRERVTRSNELLDSKLKKETDRKAWVERMFGRKYNYATDEDLGKSYNDRQIKVNEMKQEKQFRDQERERQREIEHAKVLQRIKPLESSWARMSGQKMDYNPLARIDYLPAIESPFVQSPFGKEIGMEFEGQVEALAKQIHDLQRDAKIQLSIDDSLAVTPLEGIRTKMRDIQKTIAEMKSLQNMFPGLKGNRKEAEKIDEQIKKLEDTYEGLRENEPVQAQKEIADKDLKRMVSEREAREYKVSRLAGSSLSGKEEEGGFRQAVAAVIQNRQEIAKYKSELNQYALETSNQPADPAIEAHKLNIRREIHDLEMRDAALVAQVDRAHTDASVKVKENAQAAYENTRKAMGSMSDVDMARARITAGRFKRGELKQFGEEAFNMPVEMRKQFTDVETLFPGMRIMPEMNAPPEWFERAERKGPNGEKAYQPFAPLYDEMTKGLTISMTLSDTENKLDQLGNSLIGYLSTNIGQLWDELIARTEAAARPPQTKKVQGTVR